MRHTEIRFLEPLEGWGLGGWATWQELQLGRNVSRRVMRSRVREEIEKKHLRLLSSFTFRSSASAALRMIPTGSQSTRDPGRWGP